MAEQQQSQEQRERRTEARKRQLSQALSDVSQRAKQLVEDQKKADRQERAELDALRQKAKARAQQMDQESAQEISSLRAQVRDKLDQMKSSIGQRKQAGDVKAAEMRAERAEDFAAEVIALVSDGIDEAESAILDAIEARADAEEIAQRSGGATVH